MQEKDKLRFAFICIVRLCRGEKVSEVFAQPKHFRALVRRMKRPDDPFILFHTHNASFSPKALQKQLISCVMQKSIPNHSLEART